MSAFTHSTLRASALALLLSTTILAGSAMAEPLGNTASGAPNSTMMVQSDGSTTTAPDTNVPGDQPMANEPAHPMHHEGMMKPPSPAEMQKHVEERIKELHQQLAITPAEEPAFDQVAQTMRDNEAQISSVIQDHEANRGKLNAVDSLNSYAKIMQAHVDGLKKISDSFSALYNEMTPEQKATADKVFSQGPEGPHHMKKHMHKKAAQ